MAAALRSRVLSLRFTVRHPWHLLLIIRTGRGKAAVQSSGKFLRVIWAAVAPTQRIKKKPGRWIARASSTLPKGERDGDGRETITIAYLPLEANCSSHMPNETL